MDFPKSVPSVGLVGGKFVDENPLLGTPGSLIPCQWGNAVTSELLAVIQAAGLVPDEEDNGQLLQAIGELLGVATPEATDTVLGLVKQATKAEAEDGLDDKKSMSALRVHQAIAKKAASVVISTAASKVLVANDLGLVLVDSAAGATTITLPASNVGLGVRDVIVRRVDNGGNRLTVTAAGNDKIKFHTHLRAEGYPFFVLMGAGDWWHLRSDGAGSWFPIGRFDSSPLGRPVFETTTAFQPGGWAGINGFIYNRAEWPWTWDHARASGMLTTEALRAGNEGKWTTGDGVSTFRSPEGRGEFMRVLDESRGVDAERVAGSWQDGTWLRTIAQEWSGSDIATGTYVLGNAHAQADGRLVNAGTGQAVPAGALVPAGSAAYQLATTDNAVMGSIEVNTQALNNWIRFRSRNIAYPGRLKLI